MIELNLNSEIKRIPPDPEIVQLFVDITYGSQEREICDGDQARLEKGFNKCEKSRVHKNFIPLKNLRLDHFPEGYRLSEYLDLVHCLAALTVKLSPSRRSDLPEAEGGPGSFTGFVLLASESPTTDLYQLEIMTATHGVYENVKVTVEFSYFDESRTHKAVKLPEMPFIHSNFGEDFSILTVKTEDEALFSKVKECINHMNTEILKRNPPSEWVPIVSHPHGLEKRVSFGTLHSEDSLIKVEQGPDAGPICPWVDYFSPIRYTTATCSGSSGARVFLWSNHQRLVIFLHQGSTSDDYNMSGRGFRYHDLLKWIEETADRPMKPRELKCLCHCNLEH